MAEELVTFYITTKTLVMNKTEDRTGTEKVPIKEDGPSSKLLAANDSISYDSEDYKEKVKANESLNIILTNLLSLQKTILHLGGLWPLQNWLEKWEPFMFEGLDDDTIKQKKYHIELIARGLLSLYNSTNRTHYEVDAVDWVRIDDNPSKLKLEVFLNPPAVRKLGGGQGSVTPTSPPQPPPPTF